MRLTATGEQVAAAAVLVVCLSAGCGSEPSEPAGQTVPWALTAEPDGSTVPVRAEFGGSSCNTFDEWQVDESDSEVEVTAVVTFSGAAGCTEDLVFEPFTVRLADPLGNRRLVGCDPDDAEANCATVATP